MLFQENGSFPPFTCILYNEIGRKKKFYVPNKHGYTKG